MLKTVSSVANALGALNYKGTWNATSNTPTLASGVGTQGDYYVVSVAGTTDLNGITNWGVGDWAAFNGSVWQRVEGGADGNFVNLDVTGQSTTAALTVNTTDANHKISGGAGDIYTLYAGRSATDYYIGRDASGAILAVTGTAAPLLLKTNNTTRLNISTGGDVAVSTGNLVMSTSGSGIDFSATAGTGTSELLSDYEEGDWTPTLQATDGAFNSVTYDTLTGGKYTKIGNVVHIQCYMRTDALDNTVGRSGDVVIEGLPFASVTASTGINGHSAFSVGITSAFAGENPSMSFVGGGGQTGMQLMYQTAADGNTSNLKPSDLGTGVNSNIVLISGTYTSA